MILTPPADMVDNQPLYHISVSMNPFIPSSSVTMVERAGKRIAEFE
jgi:hypothetical protein